MSNKRPASPIQVHPKTNINAVEIGILTLGTRTDAIEQDIASIIASIKETEKETTVRIDNIKIENESLKEDFDVIKIENESLKEDFDVMKNEFKSFINDPQNSQVKSKAIEDISKVEEYVKNTTKNLTYQVSSFKAELESFKSNTNQIDEALINQLRSEISTLRSKIESLERKTITDNTQDETTRDMIIKASSPKMPRMKIVHKSGVLKEFMQKHINKNPNSKIDSVDFRNNLNKYASQQGITFTQHELPDLILSDKDISRSVHNHGNYCFIGIEYL